MPKNRHDTAHVRRSYTAARTCAAMRRLPWLVLLRLAGAAALCMMLAAPLPFATLCGLATATALLSFAAALAWWRWRTTGVLPRPHLLRIHAYADGALWAGFALCGVWLADRSVDGASVTILIAVLLGLLVAACVLLDGWPPLAHPLVLLTAGGTATALLLADPRPPLGAALLTLALGGALLQVGLHTDALRRRSWRRTLTSR